MIVEVKPFLVGQKDHREAISISKTPLNAALGHFAQLYNHHTRDLLESSTNLNRGSLSVGDFVPFSWTILGDDSCQGVTVNFLSGCNFIWTLPYGFISLYTPVLAV